MGESAFLRPACSLPEGKKFQKNKKNTRKDYSLRVFFSLARIWTRNSRAVTSRLFLCFTLVYYTHV